MPCFILYNISNMKTLSLALAATKATNPFDKTDVTFLNIEPWVGYTFGSIFILLGIAVWFLYPKSKRKADDYKKQQLIEYNKQKNRNETSYERTGMFLPPFEKAKMFAPVFFGIIFIFMGISWIVGNTLTVL